MTKRGRSSFPPRPVLRQRAGVRASFFHRSHHSSFIIHHSSFIISPLLLLLLILAILCTPVLAQSPSSQPAVPEEFKDIGLIEHPGASLPLDLTFEDDTGQTLQLRQFFHHDRPVVLQLGYFGCPMLCGLVSQGIVDSLRQVSLHGGKDYDVIFLSINPSETSSLARQKKQSYITAIGRPDEAPAWHFLTGKKSHIDQVANTVGFKYKWIESDHQFAHPAGIIILSPDGRVSRYLAGVVFDPKTMRYSLIEAAQGKIGTISDQIWLTCFHYDPAAGTYTLAATNIMRAASALSVLILATIIFRLLRRERAQRQNPPATESNAT